MDHFNCNNCRKSFNKVENLNRHKESVHNRTVSYVCEICKANYNRKDNLKRHQSLMKGMCKDSKKFKSDVSSITTTETSTTTPTTSAPSTSTTAISNSIFCNVCQENVEKKVWSYHKMTNIHKKNSGVLLNQDFNSIQTGFRERLETLHYENKNESELRAEIILERMREPLFKLLEEMLLKHKSIKFNIELFGTYIKMTDEQSLLDIKTHQTKMMIVTGSSDFNPIYKQMIDNILMKMSEFQEKDSGWSLIKIGHILVNVNQYKPLRGSNYIKLPQYLKNKKACINIQNDDVYCFKWAIISAFVKIDDNKRSNICDSYKINNIADDMIILDENNDHIMLNFMRLTFPLPIKEIKNFENQNPFISINVFGYDDDLKKVVGPYYITEVERVHHINLILLQDGDRSHYVWIKNLSRLIMKQVNSDGHALHICNTCLYATKSLDVMNIHRTQCNRIVTEMVNEEKMKLKFEHFERRMDVPFVVYADFECILNIKDDQISESVKNVQLHKPCAFSYLIKCSFNSNLDKLVVYSGEKVSENFVKMLTEDIKYFYENYISVNVPLKAMTPDDWVRHRTQNCHICDTTFNNSEKRVIDHCHMSGKYRGPAHNKCNLNYKIPNFVPIFFHNFTSYDCHLFIKDLTIIEGEIKVLPLNKEKYISLSKIINIKEDKKIELRFLDSFRFMSSSLEELANNLQRDNLIVTKKFYSEVSKFELICRKGVFPYDYVNNIEKLNEQQLPERKHFFNKLTNTECSLSEYQHAKNVWNNFNCITLRDYMEIYLKTDVLLLTDVFENFRKICKNIHKLDPCQYYTAPGLSWDAMLFTTAIELDLFTDINMYTFMQRGMRGGLVQCSQRHSVANNQHMSEYDDKIPSQYLIYFDANNLYGWAMSQNLPSGGFQWVENPNSFDVSLINDCSNAIGYIFEVDLDYPVNIHDLHNDLPFCPENKKNLSSSQVKLIADLKPKKNYIIHQQYLKQSLDNGLVLKKIHKILKFNQSPWLKKYIDVNNHHRTLAKNTFEKNFFKLLNNSVYGKTMENVDKRKDVKIVTKWESRGRNLGARALIAKPNFHSVSHFCENMYAIQMSRVYTVYNKPLYLGFCVLELSKWKMYDFHYSYIKPKFADRVQLNYMDTDSFIYTIKTNDFYADIKPDIVKYFDTSEYPEENKFKFPLVNKKVLGMMKDENAGKIMREFVGLRSKMYSINVDGCKEIKKSKGVKKSALGKLTIHNYKDCLLQRKILYDSMYMFRSYAHELYTQQYYKVVLSYTDDKRYIQEDGVNTLAWGHYKISDTSNLSKNNSVQ